MDEIPDNFFISEDYKEYTETICGYTQTFYASPAASTDYDLTGQVLWPGAQHLSKYILSNKDLIQDKVILEVGSGSGLCGLICSNIASKVILTDGNDIVLRLLEKNKPFGKNVEVALLEWNDDAPAVNLARAGLPEKYEVIIGADVVYWSSSIIPLFSTVNKLLDNQGKFFMCYTARANNTFRDLLQWSSEAGFSNQVLWQEDNTYIYCFTRV